MSGEWDEAEIDPADILRRLSEVGDDGYTGAGRLGLDRADEFALRMTLHQQVNERDDPDFAALIEHEHAIDAVAEQFSAEAEERERMAEEERTNVGGSFGLRVAARRKLPLLTADERQARMVALMNGDITIGTDDE